MVADPAYHIPDQWLEAERPVRIICAGAGPAGILAAYKVQKDLPNASIVCYEKNPSIGGTCLPYPCRQRVAVSLLICIDSPQSPAHAYTYPFEPNPEWSSFYAGSPEILEYFKKFTEKYDLNKYIKVNSKVSKAIWDDEKGIYNVTVETKDGPIEDWCHVLINATGYLNSWKWPDVKGLNTFKGTLLHSANWDTSIDWKDKRVAILGTGSSAIQMVPQIQKTAKSLVTFMRSETWISPPVAGDILEADKTTSTDKEASKRPEAQYYYTEEEKRRFREDPEALTTYRRNFEIEFNKMFDMFIQGTDAARLAKEFMTEEMKRRIGPGHEELKERMIPKWPVGCRRVTPGDGYLEALVQPNVRYIFDEIAEIVPEGLRDAKGELHEVDIIACATGFNIAFTPSFEIKGAGGVDMHEFFNPEPQVYLGLAAPNFPNYFIINGVRGNWAAGTVLITLEVSVNYIVESVKKIQKENIKSMVVRQECVDQLYQHIDEWHKRSVWNADCKNWYKQNIVGGKLWIWGGSGLHYNKTIQKPRFEDYTYKYRDGNMWAYLGNGFTEAQVNRDSARLGTYMRASDTPFELY
ncbi:hypothetical protein AYO21_10605 [Fonsecaea monophora]|uniref:FAD/NAD(P)-binding domain-containing protein n=1 Tax=Fonsecaea monophora TaxID=254056 RepID=A0A177ET90_9EURO|nr:hypothetical protein AYO21_10605 [Fonsecaea monophora]OAG35207.1 hypothetical protein AYO21_10605 [Fonsecaea monophora]